VRVEVAGTHLWFDVEGAGLVPDGPAMREQPTLLLLHGGPGSYDHSYLKPHFAALTDVAQVIYLDLRDHGRSDRGDPAAWTFERCADDVRALCDALGIVRPVVLGHSMGGFVALLYGARHPDHPGGLVLQSTMVRFDLDRIAAGFRRFGGQEVGELARQDYAGEPISDGDSARVFAAFGPNVPGPEALARRLGNPAVGGHGMTHMRRLDVRADAALVACPTLVSVGELDAITPVGAAREIAEALPAGIGRLEVLPGAGHFPWLDRPDQYFAGLRSFIARAVPR